MKISDLLPAIEEKLVPVTNAVDNGLAQIGSGAKNFAKGFMDPNQYSDPNTTDPNSAQYQGALVGNYPGGAEVSGGIHASSHLLPEIAAAGAVTSVDSKKVLGAAGRFLKGVGSKTKQDGIIDRVVSPDIAKSLQGMQHTSDMRDALVRNGVTDINDIGQKANDIYTNIINPTLAASPKILPLDTTNGTPGIIDMIVSEMRKLKPGLDPVEAKRAAHGVIGDLYNVGRNTSPDTLVPTHIDTPSLFNIRQELNGTQAVHNFFNGHPVGDITDLATLASRNAISKAIAIAHPTIAQATHDYGLLNDAVPSVYKETMQATKNAAADAVPNYGTRFMGKIGADLFPGNLIAGGINAATNGPKRRKALLGLGVGSTLLGAGDVLGQPGQDLSEKVGNAFNSFPDGNGGNTYDGTGNGVGNPSNINGQHGQSISQQLTNSNPDAQGGVHLPTQTTPNPNSPYITNQQFSDMTAGMSPNSTEYQRLYTQWQNSQKQAEAKFQNNTLMRFMDQADRYFYGGSMLEGELNQIPLNIWDKVRTFKDIQAYTSNPKRPYAGQLADIAIQNTNFQSVYRDATGSNPPHEMDLAAGQSPEQFKEILQRQQKFMFDTYKTYQEPYLVVTSPNGAQTTSGKAQAISPVTRRPAGSVSGLVGGSPPDLSQMPAIPQ